MATNRTVRVALLMVMLTAVGPAGRVSVEAADGWDNILWLNRSVQWP